MIGKLSSGQIEEVLNKGLVGRIGCSADGETYIVPISYGYDGQFIYCHTKEGKKTEMMRKNPHICFQVDDMTSMANWKSVILQCDYQELTAEAERVKALQVLLNRYLPVMSSITTHLGELWPFAPKHLNEINGVVFRQLIRKKSGRFEATPVSPHMPG